MEDKCIFIQDDLDNVTLTEEEIQDLNENYDYFENFRDSDSGSTDDKASADSDDSPPVSLSQDEVAAQEAMSQLSDDFSRLSHRDEPLVPLTLSELAAKHAEYPSQWNNNTEAIASSVYSAFGVSAYIVDPNYLLCISKHGTCAPWAKENFCTINEVLRNIAHNPQPETVHVTRMLVPDMTFPSWVDIKDDLLDVLDVFSNETCKCIPDSLNNREAATAFLSNFMDCIKSKSWKSHGNAKSNFFMQLRRVCYNLRQSLINMTDGNKVKKPKKLGENAEEDKSTTFKTIRQSLFEKYFNCLINLFQQITSIPLTLEPKSKIPLNIASSRGSVGSGEPLFKDVEPDFQISLFSEVILVGKVRTFGSRGLKSYKSRKGHRVKTDTAASHTTQATKQSSDPRHDPRHYRHLDKAEKYKVRKFLPQLIAEMLVCRGSSEIYFNIGHWYENIQMGFAIEGFKLRFVRMVIRNNKSPDRPEVNDLIDNRMNCDIFLTQEFNLLKKSHITMVFQILLALSYHCYTRTTVY